MDRIRQVETIVRQQMSGMQAGHGFDHVDRVRRLAIEIHAEVGGDRTVIELAALLHDVGDAKFHAGVEKGAVISGEILESVGADPKTIRHIQHIVDNLSFRKRDAAEPLSHEGRVVQDADRLDALGAIGIVRTIEYGASIGQPFYLPQDSGARVKTGLEHFDEKLFKLPDLMNTETARRIAARRVEFMRRFIEQLLSECERDG